MFCGILRRRTTAALRGPRKRQNIQIGDRLAPEIALLPIGAYHPESFRHVHMGPDEAVKAFKDLRAKVLVPMHFGTFKLSFESLEEPPRWLREIVARENLTKKLHVLEEGAPEVF